LKPLHAGELGDGFAVVAGSCGALKHANLHKQRRKSQKNGQDIQTETNEVVAAKEAGTEQVEATRLVDAETRQSLN